MWKGVMKVQLCASVQVSTTLAGVINREKEKEIQ